MRIKILIVCLIIMLLVINITNVYGVDVTNIINNQNNTTPIDTPIINIMSNIYGVVVVVGVAIAFGMLIFVGIKIMSAAPSERADVKKHMIPFFIGAIFILGAGLVATILRQFAEELVNVI